MCPEAFRLLLLASRNGWEVGVITEEYLCLHRTRRGVYYLLRLELAAEIPAGHPGRLWRVA
jgi:hypothetical protein